MNYQTPSDPFPISSYYGPDYFCDREEESAHIKRFFKMGNLVFRWGIEDWENPL
jgi:hypothetical protein